MGALGFSFVSLAADHHGALHRDFLAMIDTCAARVEAYDGRALGRPWSSVNSFRAY
jgi:hypothetical protein